MSSLAFLVTELQSLASETRRKHPEIREAAEKSLAILRASPEQATANLASDGPQSDDLLKPVFMGCATKNAKVVAISLGSLQRLISLKAVPQSAVPLIISTMSDAMSQGVDIQLRILQTLVSLVPNFPAIHGGLLGDALLLCFKLQESRIAVVSSTAAATLRQLVMFVMDKMVLEDRVSETEDVPTANLSEVMLPDGTTKLLGPSAKDAFSVFEDLCLLANSERPHFLKLEFLHKTFALELIESVLTNYHHLFRQRTELILLLRHHLCPLLLKSLSDRPHFPLLLRCTRVVFLLLKKFSLELETEVEVFLMMLIRIISDEGVHESTDSQHPIHYTKPLWMRVLAMEIMRGLCSDAELIRSMWDRYDAQHSGSKAVSSLITALKRLVTEKPALLGVGTQMGGVGVQPEPPSSSSGSGAAGAAAYGLDMAGRVASATMSGVVGMIGGGAGLSTQGSSMKLQCIDQLDKADAPAIPESYIYLLAVQCIISLCEGFAAFSGPIYSTIAMQRPRAAGDAVVRAPPALDLDTLPQDDVQTKNLRTVQSIISQAWPALLAALSFIIATNLSDELFVDVLASYQAMTNVSGMLGLATPRDAFFNSLSKFAVPIRVVSQLEAWVEHPPPQTPRSATAALSEGLGLGGPTQPPGLSERNMACLKVLLGCSLFLAGSLGESWYAVLEALQNADGVLTMMAKTGAGQGAAGKKGLFGGGSAIVGPTGSGGAPASRSVSMSGTQSNSSTVSTTPKHPLLSDLDVDTMQFSIQRLFDSSKNLEDSAFRDFVNALCKLSSEMVGMQTSEVVPVNESAEDGSYFLNVSNKSQESVIHRRRVSGIQIPKNFRAGDFGISKLGGVAMLNIHRLIYRSPDIAWNTTTSHLLMIIRLGFAPQAIRIQAAKVLDEILLIVPRNLSSTGGLQAEVQRRVIDVLAQQVVPDSTLPLYQQTSTSVELRRMGLETLHQILQAAGHTLVVGWETIFQMLESVCRPASSTSFSAPARPSRSQSSDSVSVLSSPPSPVSRTKPLPLGLGNPTEKSYNGLVKIAFQSLTLVCDSVSSLSPEHLRLCISTLGQFGHQADTNIALTAAASLLWSVSDAIQSKRKNIDEEPEYSELWMFLLLEVLGLCTDSRAEVRDGAIQTLFRTMQLYGATLSTETWEQCIWKVTFPLLDALTAEIRHLTDPSHGNENVTVHSWDESKILALYSIGSIFTDFLVAKVMLLDSFTKAWDVFVGHVEEAILLDNRSVSAPALRCLEKAIKAFQSAEGVLRVRVTESLERVWKAIDMLGSSATKRYVSQEDLENSPHQPFTQESLVAFVDVIQGARKTTRGADGKEWGLERLTRLMEILKGVLTYPNSPDYRPDIDALPPVQAVVIDTIVGIDLTVPGSPSLVMRDLANYSTLSFLASFDVQPHPKNQQPQTPQRRITYIALTKKTMPMLVELFLKFKTSEDIYVDGTLEAVLSAYSIPVKLKYDCPSPSKYGKDLPLWKTATTCFLRIVKECTAQVKNLGETIPDERVEGIWRQILDVFRGGILADCSFAETFPIDLQEAEENFDLALIASLEIDVVPHLGGARVPDVLVAELGKILQRGSKLYEADDFSPISRPSSISPSSSSRTVSSPIPISKTSSSRSLASPSGSSYVNLSPPSKVVAVDLNTHYSDLASTDFGSLLPRERFSYWCFDLLFLICSDITRDQEDSRKRLAALSLSSLLNRCRTTLVGYVADESLRGNMPFPRAREEELLYVLRKILELRLWPGSLWAALSDNPTQYCITQPAVGTDMPIPATPRELISDSVKRSTIAHLFHFYPILCEIATIPRKSPTSWIPETQGRHAAQKTDKKAVANVNGKEVPETGGTASPLNGNNDSIKEFNARILAGNCLKEVGREMGVSR